MTLSMGKGLWTLSEERRLRFSSVAVVARVLVSNTDLWLRNISDSTSIVTKCLAREICLLRHRVLYTLAGFHNLAPILGLISEIPVVHHDVSCVEHQKKFLVDRY